MTKYILEIPLTFTANNIDYADVYVPFNVTSATFKFIPAPGTNASVSVVSLTSNLVNNTLSYIYLSTAGAPLMPSTVETVHEFETPLRISGSYLFNTSSTCTVSGFLLCEFYD